MALANEPRRAEAAAPKIRSWGYQLQGLNPAAIGKAGCDLLVIDQMHKGRPIRRPELSKIRNGGKKKPLILAYLSIGEAEDYRYYWSPKWRSSPPGWLGPENGEWPGNYEVKFWDPAWQSIFLNEGGYIDRIAKAGFDGIYLDRTDAFESWTTNSTAEAQMIAFVEKIAARARMGRPGFLVFAQNGEKLLEQPAYRAVLDGVAKEDLYYGAERDRRPNSAGETAASLSYLHKASASGLPVLLVEYLKDPDAIRAVRENAEKEGFPLLVADRNLAKTPRCQ